MGISPFSLRSLKTRYFVWKFLSFDMNFFRTSVSDSFLFRKSWSSSFFVCSRYSASKGEYEILFSCFSPNADFCSRVWASLEAVVTWFVIRFAWILFILNSPARIRTAVTRVRVWYP